MSPQEREQALGLLVVVVVVLAMLGLVFGDALGAVGGAL